jgi:NAD(P)H dehydrogenase (quinone)
MKGNDDRLFLIAAATGKTGTTSVRLLLERGHRARAFVHQPDGRSARWPRLVPRSSRATC